MIGKKLINTGGAEAAFLPSQHFDTVTYTGNGGTQRIGGYINRGAAFNGLQTSSASYIDIPSSTTSTTSTVSFWMNTTVKDSNFGSMFDAGGGSSVNTGFSITRAPTSGYLQVNFTHGIAGQNQTFTGTTDICDGTWHHISLVMESDNTFICYLDGVSHLSGTRTYWTSGDTHNLSNNRLGTNAGSVGASSYGGKIDQVRIFNKALSSSEVTTLYGETAASTSKSVTDIFNDDSGVALYQLDGNANDTGGVSGKFGSAAIFNGSGYISGTLNIIKNLSSDNFSMSFWVKPSSIGAAQYIFSNMAHSGARHIFIILNTNGTVVFRTRNGGVSENDCLSTTVLSNNNWYLITATYSTASGGNLYINETLEDTTGYVALDRASHQSSNIGNYSFTNSSNFIGNIDQVRIYSSALSSSDVTNLYNESSVPTANLVAHYKLDGDARDEQQQYDGTATNVIYAYDGTATNVTYQKATDFQPDLVWIKSRSNPSWHSLQDSVRGATKTLFSNTTNAEVTYTDAQTSFDSNGFTLGADVSGGSVNVNGRTYVGWCWKAGGAAVSNTDGTITSQVSANQAAGFSIVKWNNASGTNQRIGHGLSSAPELIIYKATDAATNWYVGTTAIDGSMDVLTLNTTAAKTDDSATYLPTSTTITNFNFTGNWISYCFHSVEGYSKIGSYTGATGGVIVETGFQPKWIMIKDTTDGVNHWVINDADRDTSNPRTAILFPNLSNAEGDNIVFGVNFTSNGFEIPSTTTSTAYNKNGNTYIYLAIAADPDVTQPVVENSFDVVTYTGNGGTQSIDTDFKPDLVWAKARSAAYSNVLTDSVRGAGAHSIFSDLTIAEDTSTSYLSSFDTNGFTLTSQNGLNQNGQTYVAWVWKAGDHDDNLPQINTNGTIDSVVSVNAAAGFSIVKYKGNATSGSTIGHGLSQAPDLIFIKNIDKSANYHWTVYSNTPSTGATGLLYLNLTEPFTVTSSRFNNTTPTSSVITLGNDGTVNESGDEHIAYCFHSVDGYQKIGNYSGTGASGQTITTGFQPRFLMVKAYNTGSSWFILDSVRNPNNPRNSYFRAETNNAEANAGAGVNFLANSFEFTGQDFNDSGVNWIYLAIA